MPPINNNRPIFIVGNPRSGTTLLRFMLSSHGRIYVPPETGFIPHFFKYTGRVLSAQDTESILRQIEELNVEWEGISSDPAEVFRQMAHPTIGCLLDLAYRRRSGRSGDFRWGDKTPIYVQYIRGIDRIFPDAQFVHIIRDCRATVNSSLKKWKKKFPYLDTYYLAKNWVRNVSAGQAAGQWLPEDRYTEVRYEDLVTDTRGTLADLFQFLGEDFSEQALQHQVLANAPTAECAHPEVLEPVSAQSVDSWKSEMTEFQKRLTHYVAADKLAELGYDVPASLDISLADRTRIAGYAVKYLSMTAVRNTLHATGVFRVSGAKQKRPKFQQKPKAASPIR